MGFLQPCPAPLEYVGARSQPCFAPTGQVSPMRCSLGEEAGLAEFLFLPPLHPYQLSELQWCAGLPPGKAGLLHVLSSLGVSAKGNTPQGFPARGGRCQGRFAAPLVL